MWTHTAKKVRRHFQHKNCLCVYAADRFRSVKSRRYLILLFLLGDTPQWCVVCAMVIVFLLLLYLRTISCQLTTTPAILYNCSFSNNTYLSNAAVSDQFQLLNRTSISLTASYAFASSTTFELGLIYPFSSSNYLVPFPIVFDCAAVVHSCQLKTMTGTTITTRDSEPIRVQLTSFNYTITTPAVKFSHMSLYLKQGRYQLSNCSLNDEQQTTDPHTVFYIQIQYEKPVGTPCDLASATCGSPSLTTCTSSKCACRSTTSSIVSYTDSFYCADIMNASDCRIFPSRCIFWCNQTTNYLCICPSDTLKIQRNNNIFVCELPVNADNCSANDDVRRCSLGQCCLNGQCTECAMATSTTTSKTLDIPEYSVDDRLRIALGVIAGLLVMSVVILSGAFCWLRRRQKRCRLSAEKSLESSSSSSLYIAPIQQQQGKYTSSISPIYHLSYTNENKTNPFFRTDSFRQAVSVGHREKQLTEHVSTKRDSFVREKDGWSSPTFSTLEYVIPTTDNENANNNNNNNNDYQAITLSAPILTHAV